MPRTCTICRHEKRQEVDQALLRNESFRHIAIRFGTSTSALVRHKARDIPATLSKAKQAADEITADSLYDRLRAINRETTMILQQARKTSSHELALKAIARVERQVELEARLLGELSNTPKIAVGINVEARSGNYNDVSMLTDAELGQLIERGYEEWIAKRRL
jgi:hypothetical protein